MMFLADYCSRRLTLDFFGWFETDRASDAPKQNRASLGNNPVRSRANGIRVTCDSFTAD
jgi:hypothetical protein